MNVLNYLLTIDIVQLALENNTAYLVKNYLTFDWKKNIKLIAFNDSQRFSHLIKLKFPETKIMVPYLSNIVYKMLLQLSKQLYYFLYGKYSVGQLIKLTR